MNDEKLSAIIKLEVLSTYYTEQVLDSIFARQTKRNVILLIASNFCLLCPTSKTYFIAICRSRTYSLKSFYAVVTLMSCDSVGRFMFFKCYCMVKAQTQLEALCWNKNSETSRECSVFRGPVSCCL